jgi:pyridoxine 4-dehydrogenase
VLAATAGQHIPYVPYFPLGGFSPLQSDVLESVAKQLGATPMAVAQSWLLQHSPDIMLIQGTSSVGHLPENIAEAALALPPDAVAGWTRSNQWTPARRSVLRCCSRSLPRRSRCPPAWP